MKTVEKLLYKVNERLNLKYLFLLTLSVVAFFLISWSLKVGMDGDAPIRIEHGKANLSYFLTFGEDTTFHNVVAYESKIHYDHIKYYGTMIESSAVGISKIFDKENYHFINKTRRLVTAILSIITLFYIGLFVKEYTKQWGWGIIALILAFVSPTFIGYCFWQTKDAPVATGFVISIFYIYLIFRHYPKIRIKYFVGLSLGLIIALSVRIQGLLIIFYFLVFGLIYISLFRKNLGDGKLITKFVLISGVFLLAGYTLGFIFYPIFWEEGYFFIFKAIKVMQQHPQNPPGLFEGELVRANQLPWYYLPKMLYITFPIFSGILFIVSVISICLSKKNKHQIFNYNLLLFTFLFPILYIIGTGADIYGGWRHELFIYPSFLILGVIGLFHFLNLNLKPVFKYIPVFVISVLALKTGFWVIKNAPFQYCYYNETIGGVKGAYRNYIIDDLQVSNEIGLKYLLNKKLVDEKDIIAANTLIIHDMDLPNDTTLKRTVGFIQRNKVNWKYGIFNPTFIPPAILEKGYPPKNTIKKIEVGGVPICCIVERKNIDDLLGMGAYMKKEYQKAYELLKKAYEYDNNNYIIYPYLAALSYQFKQYTNAEIFAYKQLELYPEDKTAKAILKQLKK